MVDDVRRRAQLREDVLGEDFAELDTHLVWRVSVNRLETT